MGSSDGFSLRALALSAYGPTLLFALGEGAIYPVLPLVARHQGASLAIAAFVITLIGLGTLVTNIPASVITERVGERWALVGAGILAAVAIAICMLPSLTALMIGAALLGVASSVFLLARQKYLTEAVPISHRARALSTLGGMMRVGMFAGPFVGAALIGHWGLRAPFALAVIACLAAAVLAITVPDLEPAPAVQAAGRVRARDVLREHRRSFVRAGVGVVMLMAVRASRQAVIPLWAVHLGLGAREASIVYGIAGAVDMLMFYPAGSVMDRLGRRFVSIPMLLMLAAGFIELTFTSTLDGFIVAACWIGMANGVGSGIVMTLGADYSPAVGRAVFLGIWRLLADVGTTGGPLLLSVLTGLFGLPVALYALAGVGVAGAGVFAATLDERRGEETGQ